MMSSYICAACGITFHRRASSVRPNQRTFCSKRCHVAGQYRHGRNAAGYRIVRHEARQVYEHRLLMEQKLGRKLATSEHVHHINGDKTDNRLENLALIEKAEHHRQHVAPAFDIEKARELYLQGVGYRTLSKTFGVARQNIRACFERRGWHIEGRTRQSAVSGRA